MEKILNKLINYKGLFQISLVIGTCYLLTHGNTEGWGWLIFVLILTL